MVRNKIREWYDVKVRVVLVQRADDDKNTIILGDEKLHKKESSRQWRQANFLGADLPDQ